ncbi:MAG: Cysteine desulfurase IscS [candidate division WS2 bacterium]|uniref:Cysteine desulfurase IscS n=1 Tax=Psychracetigena formicireducens TaxID=2986056 RepID=A0A9E2BG62_PSYF1|nr:Cysteine desulfurase IscS [Candidatus Psychracetigena formicireducens]
MNNQYRKVYLDHAATTPVRTEVLEEMMPYFQEFFANPMSVHHFGQKSAEAVDLARGRATKLLAGSTTDEIIFTSGATESNNLAIYGICFANSDYGKHIITSRIEHHAVLEVCHHLEKLGYEVTYLPVDCCGLVNPDDVRKSLRKDTILVSVMHANNEIGSIQPIEEISRVVKENSKAYFHTDAVQSVGYLDVDINKMGVDLLSISAHKFYGPKGVGALYVRKGTKINPFIRGGGQEGGVRPGTHNVPGIVGLGKAAELVITDKLKESSRVLSLRDKLNSGIEKGIEDVIFNGHPLQRLPNNANFAFLGIDGEALLTAISEQGIYVSTGSACSSGEVEPSHVLLGIGIKPEFARGSLRFSLGRMTNEEDIEYTLLILEKEVRRLREISPLRRRV